MYNFNFTNHRNVLEIWNSIFRNSSNKFRLRKMISLYELITQKFFYKNFIEVVLRRCKMLSLLLFNNLRINFFVIVVVVVLKAKALRGNFYLPPKLKKEKTTSS